MPKARLTKLQNSPPNGPIILIQTACSSMAVRSYEESGTEYKVAINGQTSRLRAVVHTSAPTYPSQVLDGDRMISECFPKSLPQQYAMTSFTATRIIYDIKSIGYSTMSTWPTVKSAPATAMLNNN